MCASEWWSLLEECRQLTEQLENLLARQELGLAELLELEHLYRRRQRLLEQLQQHWQEIRGWSPEQARKWLDIVQQLLERSTRQAEILRLLLERSEQRLRAALKQQCLVRYTAHEYYGN